MQKATFTITAIAMLGSFCPALAQQDSLWVLQTTLPGEPPLYTVDAVSGDVAWIVGDAASDVYRTTNAGRTWTQTAAAVAADRFLTVVDALDSLTAFVGTFNPNGKAEIYRTTDGGASWQLVYDPPRPDNNFWGWIQFFDAQNGIALCDQAVPNQHWLIVKTADGGNTWTPIANPPAGNLNEYSFQSVVHFYDAMHGWFGTGPLESGSGGRVFRTTDGGETWAGFDSGNTDLVLGVSFISPLVGVRTSVAEPFLTRTVDGGETWTPVSNLPVSDLGVLATITSIYTANAHQLWLHGEAGPEFTPFVLTSIDSGITWQEQTIPDLGGNTIYHMAAVSFGAARDSVQAFAVTLDFETFASGGQILSYRQPVGALTAVQEERSLPPLAYTLSQNYPNPFNPQTTIQYQLPKTTRVVLRVYNIFGQEVRTLVDAQQPRGVNTAIWDGKDELGKEVSSGVYFYRLQMDEAILSRKMSFVQ